MKKFLIPFIVLIAAGISTKSVAQLSKGGVPVSFALEEKVQLREVPFMVMPLVDVEALKAEDVYNDRIKDQPWRFGENLIVSLNPDNSGIWEELEGGSRLWRLGITSKGALTINLTFDNYRLPEGATLFIYNADKSVILGAFTSLNNQDDRYFAVSPIHGESLIIEYYEPAGVKFTGELNLWHVTHGYRGFGEYVDKGFGDSGPCNVNAVCPEGDPIRDQIRSVAHIIIDGMYLCSGALINNTNNDGTPLFLSANHCSGTPGTVVFWFNWQSATCSNPGTSPAYNSLSGASLRAQYATSDFWLLQLNQTPPAEYNVYYSGWNRTTDANIAGTEYCIHHPSGDIKKISWATGGVAQSAFLGDPGSGTDHWRVGSWSDATTTEGGSSGSPLLDPQYRIIGQLHGGYAACGNTDPDWYGKLGTSWTGGGTNASRLSTWLDPASTGVTTLEGYDPNQSLYAIDGELNEILIPESSYDDTVRVIPTVVIRNNGTDDLINAAVSYKINDEVPVTYVWTGVLVEDDTDTIEFPEVKLEYGDHIFKSFIDVVDDENVDNDTLELAYHVDPFQIPNALTAEVVNENDVILRWNPKDGGSSFSDGFETGDLSLWDEVIEGPGTAGDVGNAFWYVQSSAPLYIYEGSYSALVNWGYTIDTWIVSPTVNASATTEVSFAWYSSYYWHVDPNDNGDLFVKVSTDGGSNWDEIWTFGEIGVWENWTWYETTLDLSSYAGQQIQVSFNLVANDNADVALDIVYIGNAVKKSDFGTIRISDPISSSYDARSVQNLVNRNNKTYNQKDKVTLVNYSVFRDGSEIAQTIDSTYTDIGLDYGTYTYYVVANYTDPDGSSLPSNEVEVEIADQFTPPAGLSATVTNDDVELAWNEGQETFGDGFESGDFSLWDEVIEGPGTFGEDGHPFWYVQSTSPDYIYDGTYGALVNWGYTIDTWIITPKIIVTGTTYLSFYWNSSYYWHVDPYDNGDLFVKVSDDGGESWITLWTFGDIGIWENWTWYETTIDLSVYAGSILNIAFNVVANDNSDVAMDNVLIDNATVKANSATRVIRSIIPADPMAKSIGDHLLSKVTPVVPLNKATLSNYSVFRDEAQIAVTADNNYLDENLAIGTYTYYVVANYTDPEGTSVPSNEVEVYVGPNAIDPKLADPSVILYPNPSNGLFSITVDREYFVSVMDVNGVLIGEKVVKTDTESIDLSKYGQGLYMLQFRSDDTTFIMKVLVQ